MGLIHVILMSHLAVLITAQGSVKKEEAAQCHHFRGVLRNEHDMSSTSSRFNSSAILNRYVRGDKQHIGSGFWCHHLQLASKADTRLHVCMFETAA